MSGDLATFIDTAIIIPQAKVVARANNARNPPGIAQYGCYLKAVHIP
jgi:hypothetical protein